MPIYDVERDSAEWEPLAQLLGAYLYQSFDLEYPDGPWEAIADFRATEPAEHVRGAASCARRLAEESADDGVAERVVEKLGSYYAPSGDGYDVRAWLVDVADFLEMVSRRTDVSTSD